MNLAALRQRIQDLGYGTDTAAQQNGFLNAAYREVHSQMRWPFLEAIDTTSISTVAGTSAYPLPATLGSPALPWRNLDAVRITDPSAGEQSPTPMIRYMQPQELFDRLQVSIPINATPQAWTFYAQQLIFWPVPDGVYNVQIYFCIEPPDLGTVNGDNDVPLIPLAFQDVLVDGAITFIAMRERDWIGMELWQAKYDTMVNRLKEEYLLKQRQTSSEVKRSGWWQTGVNSPLMPSNE